MPDEPQFGIAEIRREFEAVISRTNEQCEAQLRLVRSELSDIKDHTERKLVPIRDEIKALKREVVGSGDHELGLVRKVDRLFDKDREVERRISVMETTVERRLSLLDDLHQKLISEAAGKTPREGVPVVRAEPSADGSTFAITVPKKFPWKLLIGLMVAGPGAIAGVVTTLQAPSEKEVQVTAQGVATMQTQYEQLLADAKRKEDEASKALVAAEQIKQRAERRERWVKEHAPVPIGTERGTVVEPAPE